MDFKGFIGLIINNLIQPIVLLISSLAVVYFLWSIAEVIRKGDQPEELSKLKEKAVWGIIAIAIMFSLWGLVTILTNTFLPSGSAIPQLNTIPAGLADTNNVSCPPGSNPATCNRTGGFGR